MLNENEAISYWKERSERLGEASVGFADKNILQQDLFYINVKSFIFTYVSRILPVVDYGCGIGRYSGDFMDKYLGIDVTENMINIAKRNNVDKNYMHIKTPYLSTDIDISWAKLFFTATVLQHCDNDLVIKILKSIYNLKPNNLTFALYENSHNFKKPHIVGREPEIYLDFLNLSGFKIKYHKIQEHINNREKHSLLIAEA